MRSIRFFLVAVLLATMTLTVFLSALHGYRSSMQALKELLDSELADRAQLLATTHLPAAATGRTVDVTDPYAFQVWRQGELVVRSSNAPVTEISAVPGFAHHNFSNQRWRTYTLDSSDGRRVITAERVDTRNRLAEGIITSSVLPVVAALPLAGLLIWMVVGYGMSPLRNLAWHLRARRADDLSPVPVRRQPVELMQVVTSMNELLDRLAASVARDRRFAADAAHELRTPLSAIKVHLHNLARSREAGEDDLAQLNRAVDRMTNLVDKMLLLYRTAPDHYAAHFENFDMLELTRDVIADLYDGFEGRDIQVELEGETAVLSGDRFAIETLLKNLLDNACKYTPAGGMVRVSLAVTDDTVTIGVEDSGPGVEEGEYQRIFDRFYRVGGDRHGSGVVGAGLGLAIVRHIADLHGAVIDVGRSRFDTGLAIRVCVPRGDWRQTG